MWIHGSGEARKTSLGGASAGACQTRFGMCRRPSRRFWSVPVLGLALGTVGCVEAAIGLGVFGVGAGTAVLVSECYDHVQISVTDETGRPDCDAEVVAVRGDDVEPGTPCHHLALTPGQWSVRVSKPGYEDQSTTVTIGAEGDEDACKTLVHTVDFQLVPEGARERPPVRPRPPPPADDEARVAPVVPPPPADEPPVEVDAGPPRFEADGSAPAQLEGDGGGESVSP